MINSPHNFSICTLEETTPKINLNCDNIQQGLNTVPRSQYLVSDSDKYGEWP